MDGLYVQERNKAKRARSVFSPTKLLGIRATHILKDKPATRRKHIRIRQESVSRFEGILLSTQIPLQRRRSRHKTTTTGRITPRHMEPF